MRIPFKMRKIDLELAKELDDIKVARIRSGIDRDKISDARLTRAMRMDPLWPEIKQRVASQPRNPDFDVNIFGRKKRKMNRRGSLFDSFTFIGVALFVVLALAGLIYLVGHATDALKSVDAVISLDDGQTVAVNLSQTADDTLGKLDIGVGGLRFVSFMILIAMALSILISNFLVKAHPAWLAAYVLVTLIAVISAAPVSNAYEGLLQNDPFDGTLSTFGASSFLILHLPAIIAVVGVFGAIFLFINITRDSELGGSPDI